MDRAVDLAQRNGTEAEEYLNGCLAEERSEAPAKSVVHVVEADLKVRRSICWILRAEGYDVRDFSSGEEFLSSLDMTSPSCLLVNLQLRGMSGVALLEELSRRHFQMPVILLSGYGEPMAAIEAFRSGAFDVVGEGFDVAVIERVRSALASDARRRWRMSVREGVRGLLSTLSERESQILDLIVRGHANKVIACDLELSERTIECHRASLMTKLQAKTVVDLVRIVMLDECDLI